MNDDFAEVLAGRRAWAVAEGDCLDVLPTMPDGCVDAVITDPPYGIAYQSAWRTDKQSRFDRIANDGQPFIWWLYAASRLLRDGGCLVCFCRWDTAEAFRLAIRWAGLKPASQMVWDREAHGLGDPSSRPAPQHDTIWLGVKGRFAFHGRRPSSVYRNSRVGGGSLVHPNEKPVGLMEAIVSDYCPVGSLVLDPFCGSGSTGVACRLTGRRFLGVELNPEYAALSRSRIADACPLLDAAASAGEVSPLDFGRDPKPDPKPPEPSLFD